MLLYQHNPCSDCKSAQQCTIRGHTLPFPQVTSGSVPTVEWACGRGQTHRHAWPIYISRRLRLTRNVTTKTYLQWKQIVFVCELITLFSRHFLPCTYVQMLLASWQLCQFLRSRRLQSTSAIVKTITRHRIFTSFFLSLAFAWIQSGTVWFVTLNDINLWSYSQWDNKSDRITTASKSRHVSQTAWAYVRVSFLLSRGVDG